MTLHCITKMSPLCECIARTRTRTRTRTGVPHRQTHPFLSQIPTGSRTLPEGSPTYLPLHWRAIAWPWPLSCLTRPGGQPFFHHGCYAAGRTPAAMHERGENEEGRNERSTYAKRTSSSWSIYWGRRRRSRRGQTVTPPSLARENSHATVLWVRRTRTSTIL